MSAPSSVTGSRFDGVRAGPGTRPAASASAAFKHGQMHLPGGRTTPNATLPAAAWAAMAASIVSGALS